MTFQLWSCADDLADFWDRLLLNKIGDRMEALVYSSALHAEVCNDEQRDSRATEISLPHCSAPCVHVLPIHSTTAWSESQRRFLLCVRDAQPNAESLYFKGGTQSCLHTPMKMSSCTIPPSFNGGHSGSDPDTNTPPNLWGGGQGGGGSLGGPRGPPGWGPRYPNIYGSK